MAEDYAKITSHTLMLENRARLRLTGVTDVDSFDDTAVVMTTALGELTVTGTGLHISNLNTDNGALDIEGSVTSLVYLERAEPGGLFSRLFK